MNYNKNGLIVLLISVFFSFGYFAYLVFFSPPMDLAEIEEDLKDSASLENQEEQGVKESSDKGPTESTTKNPWVFSETLVNQGGKLYQTYCASCHGKTGQGDGLASAGLKPPPRDLVKGEWTKGGDSISLYKTLIQGIEGTSMVSFSYLSVSDRWALVHYMRSITKNKVEDDKEKLAEFAKTAK